MDIKRIYREKYQDILKTGFEIYGFRENPFKNNIIPELIVDREEIFREFATITGFYKKGDINHLYLYGEQGCGKTLILRIIEKLLRDEGEFIPVYYDCQIGFENLYEQLTKIIKISKLRIRSLIIKQDFTQSCNSIIKHSQKKIVILLDNCTYLNHRERELLIKLMESDLALYISAFHKLEDEFETVFPRKFEISPLNYQACKDLIRERIKFFRIPRAHVENEKEYGDFYPFDSDAVSTIIRCSGGNPEKLLKLCSLSLLEALKNNQKRIGESQVIQVIYQNETLKQIYSEYSKSQRRIIEALYFLRQDTSDNIANLLSISRIAVIKHLKNILGTGIAKKRKKGKKYIYSLKEDFKRAFSLSG